MQLFLFCTQLVCLDCSKLIKCRVNSCKCHSQSYSTKSIRQVSLSEPLSPWDLAPGFADFYATNLPSQYRKCSCKSHEKWYVCPFYILIRLFIVSRQNGRSYNSWRFTRPVNVSQQKLQDQARADWFIVIHLTADHISSLYNWVVRSLYLYTANNQGFDHCSYGNITRPRKKRNTSPLYKEVGPQKGKDSQQIERKEAPRPPKKAGIGRAKPTEDLSHCPSMSKHT